VLSGPDADAGDADAQAARAEAEATMAALPPGVAAGDCEALTGLLMGPPFEQSLLLEVLATAASADAAAYEAAQNGDEDAAAALAAGAGPGGAATLPELMALGAVDAELRRAFMAAYAAGGGALDDAGAFPPDAAADAGAVAREVAASATLRAMLPYVGVDSDAVVDALSRAEGGAVGPAYLFDLLRG